MISRFIRMRRPALRAIRSHSAALLLISCLFTGYACRNSERSSARTDLATATFGSDAAFLESHKAVVILEAPDNPEAKAILVPDYQGRVMTSTSGGNDGPSYGWINYDLISSNAYQPHINAYGGEERFWLSPEGGQFSVYFEKGKSFEFSNWQTPALIDTVRYEVSDSSPSSATFRKRAGIINYSGTEFDIEIERKVAMLSQETIRERLALTGNSPVKVVGYESVNRIVNKGSDWTRETGALGIWILGMFRPGPQTTIVIPYSKAHSDSLRLTADYFGSIPPDRLRVTGRAILLKADGMFRSKIGLSPLSALPMAGSYNAGKGILTLIQYDLDVQGDYLRSTWEIHKDPYTGDALNAYNDGPLADGSQMGPFYELESNSPAKALKTGESLTHTHRTFHFEGSKETLNSLAIQVLGVSLEEIQGL